MARNFTYEVHLKHPPEKVWQALTDADRMGAWLMHSDFKPVVGHRFQFRSAAAAGSDGLVQGEVLEATAPKRLVYRWVGGPMMDTTLTWELVPAGQETHLKVTHAGFNMLKWGFVSLFLGSRWKKLDRVYLDALRDHLNR